MPCEACNIQFTVFKRKKSCTECRRLYCSNCLTKNKERILCKRCVIFTTRPLSKIELLKLKAKDLIFYLQSKHISTTGCVEKEELVNLVLIHVDNTTNFSPDSQQSPTSFSMGTDQSDDARSNPFDQIRNTCQNLFSTFTEKIAADFNFDFKQNQSDRQPNVCEDQPRYSSSFRNVPTFNATTRTNGASAAATAPGNNGNGNGKVPRPTTMTSSVNQSATPFESSNIGCAPHSINNLQTSPTTIASSSSNASTPSLLKHSSSQSNSIDDSKHRITPAPATATAASTSSTRKQQPHCNNITKLTQSDGTDAGSSCECSDDELITKFREQYSTEQQPLSPTTNQQKADVCMTVAKIAPNNNLTESSSSSTKTGNSMDTPVKDEEPASVLESSDVSSFEDLGAVGGLQTITVTTNSSTRDTDKWQIINPTWNIDDTASSSSIITDDNKNESTHVSYTTNLPNSISDLPQTNLSENQRQPPQQTEQQPSVDTEKAIAIDETFPIHSISETPHAPTTNLRAKLEQTLKSRQTHRKITRRQSDGIVYSASTSHPAAEAAAAVVVANANARFLGDLEDDEGDSSTSDDLSHKRSQKPCRKCGKTKGDLRKYIARFRHQLEMTTAFSETEIRQQLDAFLEFLEGHSAVDSKDDASTPNTELEQSPSQFVADAIELEVFDDDEDDFDDDGIHVYGSNDDSATSTHPPRQFFNLNSVEKKEELDDLSVKQLKEVLMLNRVDFKGCCEKSELLERVQRLWDDLQNCPAVDKLPTVDLCKICMDAAIECVLLECGHMATCTNCGKVLSECPICRQYIVRVVRFFKA